MDRTARLDLLVAGLYAVMLAWGAVLRVEFVQDTVLRSWLVGAPLVLFAALVVYKAYMESNGDDGRSPSGRDKSLRSAALTSFGMTTFVLYARAFDIPSEGSAAFYVVSYERVGVVYALTLVTVFPLMTLALYWIYFRQNRKRRDQATN